jgi:CHAT domain-containing protein/tetratricopeptide (TPR) repeat protein
MLARERTRVSFWLTVITSLELLVLASPQPLSAQQQESPKASSPQPASEEAAQLTAKVDELFAAEHYGEAIPLAQRALQVLERSLGPGNRETLRALVNLGRVHEAMGQYKEAEGLYSRAAKTAEETLGPADPDTFTALNNLAQTLKAESRNGEAEAINRRLLAAKEKALGPDDPSTLISVNNLAEVLQNQGRYADAEVLYLRALEARERVLGTTNSMTLSSLNNLADLYQDQGRFAEAEPLLRRAATESERVNGRDNADTLVAIENLARLYKNQGRFTDAEPLFLRALATAERTLGPSHEYTLVFANNLAAFYERQGRYDKAEPILRRAAEQIEAALGSNHEYTLSTLNNLASVYLAQNKYSKAELLFRRLMHSMEQKLGPGHPTTLMSAWNLALTLQGQKRYGETEALYRRILRGRITALGRDHPDTLTVAEALASVLLHQPAVAPEALEPARFALESLRRRRALTSSSQKSAEQESYDRSLASSGFTIFPRAAWAAVSKDRRQYARLFPDAFMALQDSISGAADHAVAEQAATRVIRERGPELGELIVERNKLEGDWARADSDLASSFGSESGQSRSAIREKLEAIEARIAAVDVRLRKEAPEYFALIDPRALDVTAAQKLLAPGDAILLVVPDSQGTSMVALTADDSLWRRSQLDAKAIRSAVDKLRYDAGARVQPTQEDEPPPAVDTPSPARPRFDRTTAHSLYKQLIAPVLPLLNHKQRIYIAAGGPLAALPFSVLVSAPPQGEDNDPSALRATHWFADDFALVHIPSIQSLALLKRSPRTDPVSNFLGVGDPVLGEDATARTRGAQIAPSDLEGPNTRRGEGVADVSKLKRLRRLPGTARELEFVRRALGAPPESVLAGIEATEPNVRNRDLFHDRIILFATHALTADQNLGAGEAGLVLTPPITAGNDDDGFLAASEVATLRLNADWVILSACNTATGDSPDDVGLGQLGRAFLFAGARNLLASHWPVSDDVAPILISRTLELERAGRSGADALREAMREIRLDAAHDTDKSTWAHPFYWAPFVLIGNGG